MSMDTAVVMKAANFAAVKHRDQRRKDSVKTPYINHPIGVAYILTKEGITLTLILIHAITIKAYPTSAEIHDPVVLQAALLHDTVEDTDTTLEEIEEHFGEKVKR